MPEGSNGGPVVHRGRLVKQRNGPAKRHRGSVMDASLWSSLAIIVPVAVKLTIIVDNPNDPGAFEAHYNSPAYKGSAGQDPRHAAGRIGQGLPQRGRLPDPRLPDHRYLLLRLRVRVRCAACHLRQVNWLADWPRRPRAGFVFSPLRHRGLILAIGPTTGLALGGLGNPRLIWLLAGPLCLMAVGSAHASRTSD